MAKLYAELTSDKGGRVVSKGGNQNINVSLSRGNNYIGTLKMQEQKGGYSVYFNGIFIQGNDDK